MTYFQVKMMSAGLAGIISDLITFPLDTAKVRLQVCYSIIRAGMRLEILAITTIYFSINVTATTSIHRYYPVYMVIWLLCFDRLVFSADNVMHHCTLMACV